MERKKILFVAEAVTLAHVARPLALMRTLDAHRYDVHVACAPGYDVFFRDSNCTRWTIHSIGSAQFLAALAAGKPVYDAATLQRYVQDDLRVLRAVRPDVVIGDFRLSLSVSARLERIPYVALINAYWSPYVRQRYSVPNIPLTRLLPLPLADALFRLIQPLAFAAHAVPLNRVRRQYGLPALHYDLRRIYTDADRTLYPDLPELFPAYELPPSHSYLGPVVWSPPVAIPSWWDRLPQHETVVYVTLGSSGQGRLLAEMLQALAALPLTVLAATAGTIRLATMPANARVEEMLPGDAAARRSRLVICNGGSPTSQQALAAGVPLIGIASNLDQFLNMQGIVAAGAGILLRADRFDAEQLRRAVRSMLEEPGPGMAARRLALLCRQYEPGPALERVLDELLATPDQPRQHR